MLKRRNTLRFSPHFSPGSRQNWHILF